MNKQITPFCAVQEADHEWTSHFSVHAVDSIDLGKVTEKWRRLECGPGHLLQQGAKTYIPIAQFYKNATHPFVEYLMVFNETRRLAK